MGQCLGQDCMREEIPEIMRPQKDLKGEGHQPKGETGRGTLKEEGSERVPTGCAAQQSMVESLYQRAAKGHRSLGPYNYKALSYQKTAHANWEVLQLCQTGRL